MRPVKVSASEFYGGICVEFWSPKGEQIRVLYSPEKTKPEELARSLQDIFSDVFEAGRALGDKKGEMDMQYNGGKKLIAPKIAEILSPYSGGVTCFEPFAGGGAVTKLLAPMFSRYVASDLNPLTVGALLAPRTGFRFMPDVVSEEYYYSVKSIPRSEEETGAVAFGLSFGGKQWGGVARPIQNYASAFNRWADGFVESTKNVAFVCAGYEFVTPLVSPGDVVYCDPPYSGTTGYRTGKFDSEAFFKWCAKTAEAGAHVFVSEERTPFTLVGEFHRPRDTNGNSSGRIDRLWKVGG